MGVTMATRTALLLRGINVGGRNKLPMAALTEVMAEDLGWSDTATYLQSGNVIVGGATGDPAGRLSRAITVHFGLDIEVLAFTGKELRAVIEDNPFPGKVDEPKNLHVAFLPAAPAEDLFARSGLVHDGDEIAVGKRQLYLAYAINSRDSPLARVLRNAKISFTARNWTTVVKLAELTA
jgi:uncharacterized protein (DUF1697 family)